MEDLIKQIEALKYKFPTGFNNGIDAAIKLLQSKPIIKAKAYHTDSGMMTTFDYNTNDFEIDIEIIVK
jgi:hypothetical protein